MSTSMGLCVFGAFLLLAVHILLGLYSTSVVGAVAADAVSRVARSAGDPATMADAEIAARRMLGRNGRVARFDWTVVGGGDQVVLRVRTPRPSVLAGFARVTGQDDIDRTVRARIERFRGP